MKALIIDDDIELCTSLKATLSSALYAVDCAHNGYTGFELAVTNHYDAIILDHNLPKQNGYNVCAELRARGKNIPILVLTVVNDLTTKINLLEIGADDYLTKPFSALELLARMRALQRRTQAAIVPLKIGPITIDTTQKIVRAGRRVLNLPKKQYELLEYLAKYAGKIVTRATILEKIWNLNSNQWSNTLESNLCELRKQLQTVTDKKLIHTVPGRGYKLIIPT